MKTNLKQNLIQTCLLAAALLALPAVAQAQFTYTTNGGTITITGYAGPPWAVTIPTNINGLPVTSIGDFAFWNHSSLTSITIPDSVTTIGGAAFEGCTNLTNITIPNSVTSIGSYMFDGCANLTNVTIPSSVNNIGYFAFNGCNNLTSVTIPSTITSIIDYAFLGCYRLTSVYFKGNAPVADWTVFLIGEYDNRYSATAYYLPGTTGWSDFSASTGVRAVPWNPIIQTGNASFGVRNNQYGFDITGTTNIPIAVQACDDLAGGHWTSLAAMTLTNGLVHFTEPMNGSNRFYRIGTP